MQANKALLLSNMLNSTNSVENADIAKFEASCVMPLDITVDIDPMQDLHGYDNPWPAGGGKNLLAMSLDNLKAVNNSGVWNGNVYTLNSVNFTVQTDSGGNVTGIVATGTASARTLFLLWTDYAYLSDMGLTDRYTLSGCPSGGGNSTYTLTLQAEGSGNISDTGASVSFDASSLTSQKYRFVAEVRPNATVSNLVFKPMLRLASVSDATYSPYSNICPISGWDGAKVTRTGRNLWKYDSAYSASGTGSFIPIDATREFALKAGTYTWSFNALTTMNTIQLHFMTRDNDVKSITFYIGSSSGIGKKSYTFSLEEDVVILRSAFCNSAFSIEDFQIELGSTAHAYEPYQAVTHEIPFSTSVYGGKLNVETGELKVTSMLEVFDTVNNIGTISSQMNEFNKTIGSVGTVGDYTRISFSVKTAVDQSIYNRVSNTYSEKNRKCSLVKHYFAYNDQSAHWYRNTVLYLFLPTALAGSTAESVFNYLASIKDTTPLSVMVELATPITLTLTPVEINSLIGENNVWSDTGNVSVRNITCNADVLELLLKTKLIGEY